ncbi:DEAD/DEAH box helicase domain-containing protein [Ditylenchus destructor]|nr:DEAD/DEAH box helicase domain-containing protein [Ditylenchus destructor]
MDSKSLKGPAADPEIPDKVPEDPAADPDVDVESDTESLIKRIPCPYTNIISEFADVEIFAISIDSMLLEFTAHNYHNWLLGGQTIVLTKQLEHFLGALEGLQAKFVLIWFSDLIPLFEQDNVLAFLHSFLIAYLMRHKDWSKCMQRFSNPLDPAWIDYLQRVTPSFMLMSMEGAKAPFLDEKIDFTSKFVSAAVHLLTFSIPVVFFNAFKVNFSNVMAYRLSTVPIMIANLDRKIANVWEEHYDQTKDAKSADAQSWKSVSQFWSAVIKRAVQSEKKKGKVEEGFENFCNAVLISALVCEKLKVSRQYPQEATEGAQKGSSPAENRFRRTLHEAAVATLRESGNASFAFPLEDLWDGRMIFGIYRRIAKKTEVLPYRLQDEFFKLHSEAGLETAVPTDTKDALMDPISPSDDSGTSQEPLKLFSIESDLLNEFAPDFQEILKQHPKDQEINYEGAFKKGLQWRFPAIPDGIKGKEEPKKENAGEKLSKNEQKLSRWYQNFADSLEGRGNDLRVDFARTPRIPVDGDSDTEQQQNPGKENGTQKSAPEKGGKGKKGSQKPGGEPKLSKAEQIRLKNVGQKNKKQIEDDRRKINYAKEMKENSITALDELLRRLDLSESKAICAYEKVERLVEIFMDNLPKYATLEEKREGALDLVEALKQCLVKHWPHMEELQKEKIRHYWASLGFMAASTKRKADKKMDLGMNLVDYQLYHGGRFIDVITKPKKDDRVTGFMPDEWQRRMLSVVDKNKSALIVAPTSAGKTFVSYYCIEKVLRASNEDVVVYVSPAKALMNQVIGSVYARFREKTMSQGRSLYGTYTLEYSDNALNCQVLVTIPECLEKMLLSSDPDVQQFVSRIKYVILDEVHCINASDQGHTWEHIFLLIRSPFLALSATVANVDQLRLWLETAERNKFAGWETRKSDTNMVELVTYDERWSELELAIERMRECPKDASYGKDLDVFVRGGTALDSVVRVGSRDVSASRQDTPTPSVKGVGEKESSTDDNIKHFHPYGVYKPEKLRMFGMPEDQRLTARQIVELYSVMSEIDSGIKEKFEPTKFFNFTPGTEDQFVWLTRPQLRAYETELRKWFMNWVENDPEKCDKIFALLGRNVEDEFEKRSKPFNMRSVALHNVVPTMDELKKSNRLPAICFNDDREICEQLAVRVFLEMDAREHQWRQSEEFRRKYDNKAQENIKLEEELRKFKLVSSRASDVDLYKHTVDHLKDRKGSHQSTKTLLRLFERGIGFHHEGLNAAERAAVEILFRAGFLGIVFSTSTLALGMNMPCKTVVFGIDTPMLTPLQFRQMSGRAGRRGFDPAGTVIFMALPTSKIRRLLTSSLATLRGNVPFTTSYLLRLFNYVNIPQALPAAETPAKAVEKSRKAKNVVETDVTNQSVRTRLLRKYQLLNEKCQPTGFAHLANHLSNFQPGNLVFIVILENGVLHRLMNMEQYDVNTAEKRRAFMDVLVNILANIFTSKPLPIYESDAGESPKPILKPMPDEVRKIVDEYSAEVDKLMVAHLRMATPKGQIQDPVFALSGISSEMSVFTKDVVSLFDDNLQLDESFVPAVHLYKKDHRGRKVLCNSYAYDFWKSGQKKDLIEFNRLSIREIWYLINEFNKLLGALCEALQKMGKSNDRFVEVLLEMAKEYDRKFRRSFGMRMEKGE